MWPSQGLSMKPLSVTENTMSLQIEIPLNHALHGVMHLGPNIHFICTMVKCLKLTVTCTHNIWRVLSELGLGN